MMPKSEKLNKQLKGSHEMRAFSMPDLAAEPDGNVVQGHAAVFDQPYDMYGCFTETIARGAFDKTDFTDVLMSINHDLSRIPLARSRNNNANSTLQLQVDDMGLATRAVLDIENNGDAKALYGSIQRGDLSGMSYIFCVNDEVWEDLDGDMPKRTITDIAKVYEVSAVSMPANPATDISTRGSDALESARRTLESARTRASLESDETDKEQREQQEKEALELRKRKIKMKARK